MWIKSFTANGGVLAGLTLNRGSEMMYIYSKTNEILVSAGFLRRLLLDRGLVSVFLILCLNEVGVGGPPRCARSASYVFLC